MDVKVATEAKFEFIRKHSYQCVVVCGPSGVGKTMSIDYMAQNYNYKSMPFITTRALRAEEVNTDSKSVSYEGFMDMRLENKVFLFAHNYGNSYGYDIGYVYEALLRGDVIMLECPAAQLLTDVQILLPDALVLGFVSFDHTMTANILEVRGDEVDIKARLRSLQSAIESSNVQLASEKMSIHQIFPTYGEPQMTINQVEESITQHDVRNAALSKLVNGEKVLLS